MRFVRLRSSAPLTIFLALVMWGGLVAADTATSAAPRADLAVTAADSLDPVLVDRGLTYRLVVSNRGPQRAERVKLAIGIAGGARLVGRPSASAGSCVKQSDVRAQCSLNTIASRRRRTVVITVDATKLGTVAVTAVVSSASADGRRRNNRARQTTQVVGIHSVQGRGIRSTMGDAGLPIVTTEINAQRDPTAGGGVTGTFVLQYAATSRSPARGSDLRGRVVCLSVDANKAMAAGVVESSNNAAYPPGTVVRIAFTDNGGVGPDTTVAFLGGEATCALEAADELPLIEGDYVVRDGEP